MIPMVDLRTQYHQLKDEIDTGLLAALENCAFVMGPNVQAFEQEVAEHLGVRHAIGCANGTEALHLALLAAGIKAGHEVITSAFTFIATAAAIRHVGARPVFVDIDPRTFNITPAAIEAAITPRTTAVMPVHLYGQPCDLTGIQAVADAHGLKIIEDCAQSFGATVGSQQTGSFGLAAGFSFFPSKNLGAYGDGGLVTTHDDAVAAQVKKLRNHGSEVRYCHELIGYNSRLDELQAVVLRVKLKRIGQYTAGRRRAAHLYSALLADLPLQTPYEDGIGVHVYHQYTLLSDQREAIMAALHEAGIACAIHYRVPLHRQQAFAADCIGVSLPVTEAVAARCLSLPIFPELTHAQVEEVVAAIRGALHG